MTDFSHTHAPGSLIWDRLSTLFTRRADKRSNHPRNPQMFVDRDMSRLPDHLLRDIGLFNGWPE